MQTKVKKILQILCLALLTQLGANELYMLPYEQDNAFNALLNAFKSAKSEIHISIYSFTHNDIAKALRDVAKRGVKVQIIYDKDSNIKNNTSTIGFLAKYKNISVCLLSGMKAKNGKYYGIMHQKMAIIDDDLLVLGSANWSKNAFENNFETLFFTRDENAINKAKAAYSQMAGICSGF